MISFLKQWARALVSPDEVPLPDAPETPGLPAPPPPPRSEAQQRFDRAATALRSSHAQAFAAGPLREEVAHLLAAGETGLARALLVDGLAVQPSVDLRARLAEVLLLRGEVDLALPLWRALTEEPGHAFAAELALGRLAEEAGDLPTARRHVERALALQPADVPARERARRLRAAEEPEGGGAGPGWQAMGRLWGQAAAGERYQVLDEIGRGGAATLYRARDLHTGREVALKVLHPRGDAGLRRERLVREAALAAGFPGLGVVPVLDVVPARDLLVMPYLEEGSLKRRLLQGPLGWTETGRLVGALAVTLGDLHRAGVAHLDVKPSNVLLLRGRPVLADFGAAAARAVGHAAGTRAYLAPEVLAGMPPDGRADFFALGVLAVECLTGQPGTALDVRDPWGARGAELVARLTHPDPAQRWAEAAEVARAWREGT